SEGDCQAEREGSHCEIAPTGKAVQDGWKRTLGVLLLEDAGGILIRLARVDLQRKAGDPGRRDVAPEALCLSLRRASLVEVIQPSLADRHHFGVRSEERRVGKAR